MPLRAAAATTAATARPNPPSCERGIISARRASILFFADDAAAHRRSKTHFLFVYASTFSYTDSRTYVVAAAGFCARRCLFTAMLTCRMQALRPARFCYSERLLQ